MSTMNKKSVSGIIACLAFLALAGFEAYFMLTKGNINTDNTLELISYPLLIASYLMMGISSLTKKSPGFVAGGFLGVAGYVLFYLFVAGMHLITNLNQNFSSSDFAIIADTLFHFSRLLMFLLLALYGFNRKKRAGSAFAAFIFAAIALVCTYFLPVTEVYGGINAAFKDGMELLAKNWQPAAAALLNVLACLFTYFDSKKRAFLEREEKLAHIKDEVSNSSATTQA